MATPGQWALREELEAGRGVGDSRCRSGSAGSSSTDRSRSGVRRCGACATLCPTRVAVDFAPGYPRSCRMWSTSTACPTFGVRRQLGPWVCRWCGICARSCHRVLGAGGLPTGCAPMRLGSWRSVRRLPSGCGKRGWVTEWRSSTTVSIPPTEVSIREALRVRFDLPLEAVRGGPLQPVGGPQGSL